MRTEIIIGTYTIVNIFALFLIDHWLCRSSQGYRDSVGWRVIVCFIYAALAFMPVLAIYIDDSLYRWLLLKYSYIWMGYIMYFGGMLLVATAVEVIVRLAHRSKARRLEKSGDPYTPEEIERGASRSRAVSAFVLVCIIIVTIGLNVYGRIHAQNTVVTHYDVKIDKPVKKVEKLRVALISDFHISYNSNPEMIENMVRKLNEQKPDVVLVCGDMFSSSYGSIREPGEYVKAFSKIKAKEGVFWVYGNHDVEEPLFCGFGLDDPENAVRTRKMKKFLKKCGFTILDDRRTAVAGGEVQLIGRADQFKPVDRARKRLPADELLNDLDQEKPILIIEHEPGDYANLAKNGADISFSGHTHNGQIFPGTIFTRLMNDTVYGLCERAGMKALVTSGVGCYGPPIRIGTDSEIVIADLTFR